MGASSVTGTGTGDSNKATLATLSALANGPAIIFAGQVESDGELAMSPPSNEINTVIFPYALPGGWENYVVITTGIGTGAAYIGDMIETDGNFTGFRVVTETEGTVMYIVTKVGMSPRV